MKLKYFEVFRINSASMARLWFFLALTTPRIVSSCWNCDQKYSPSRQLQFLKNPSKVWVFAYMEGTQSLQYWSIRGPIYHGKKKILLKIKISAKIVSLVISNKVSPRPQKNHRILVKLSKKTILGLKLPIWGCTKGSSQILTVYRKTIHLYFLNAKFQLLCICYSWLYPEETNSFFWFRTQLGSFWVNNPTE